MCVGHGDHVIDAMYLALTESSFYGDVSSLTEPDGRFMAAMRNAVTYLDNKGLLRCLECDLISTEAPVDCKFCLERRRHTSHHLTHACLRADAERRAPLARRPLAAALQLNGEARGFEG